MRLKGPLLAVILSWMMAYLAQQFSKVQPLTVDTTARLDGKHILITGGTSGVGFAAAQSLANRGATIYLTGTSDVRAKRAALRLPSTGSAHQGFLLELTNPQSVAEFASTFGQMLGTNKLDALLLNAGLMYDATGTGPWTVNFNGSEQDFMVAANHLGHFKLLKLLLPRIAASNTRVVFTSSISHQFGTEAAALPGNAVWARGVAANGEKPSMPAAFLLYGNTKLMNVLSAYKLQRLLDANDATSATVAVCTPGFVSTSIGSNNRSGLAFNPMEWIPLARPVSNGGNVLAFAATVERSVAQGRMLQPYWIWEGVRRVIRDPVARGFFFNIVQEMLLQKTTPAGTIFAHATSDVSYDEDVQDKLWAWSESIVG